MKPQNELIENRLKSIFEKVSVSAEMVGKTFEDIHTMAVTKTVDPEYVNIAVQSGIKLLGENKVQEYLEKYEHYEISDENVHFIGNLQSNKIKHIIDKVGMIESVSSINLAEEIQKIALKRDIIMPILLEVNIGEEKSKFGFLKEEVLESVYAISQMSKLKIQGLMCIPPNDKSEFYFEKMSLIFKDIQDRKIENVSMRYLSMGMSNDYEKAILYGANIIRLGQAIFGERNYWR